MRIEMSSELCAKALAAGIPGWIEELPRLVDGLTRDWGLQLGSQLAGGTDALVAAVLADGWGPAVLKVALPTSEISFSSEVTALRLANGDGCVRLLQADGPRHAMLLERLGRPLGSMNLSRRRGHEILCEVLGRLWRRRPPADSGLPSGAEKAAGLASFITHTWAALDTPCSEGAVDHALECAARRQAAHDPERAVLVHGDGHAWNALQAGDDFKMIDPDGLFAEPEYDLGVLLRDESMERIEGDPRRPARELSALTGLNVDATWEWAVVERMSTGLLCTQIGLQPTGRQMLAAADRIAREFARLE